MHATLYVADDIQSLADGKTLMVGVYTDRVLVMNVPPDAIEAVSQGTFIGLATLALMVTISDIEPGEHIAVPRIALPDGRPSPNQIDSAPFSVPVGGAANLLFKLQPFFISGAGRYTLTVEVGGSPVSADFEVRLAPIINTASPATLPAVR